MITLRLNIELAIQRDQDGLEFAKTTKMSRHSNGIPIGIANDNPSLIPAFIKSNMWKGTKDSWWPTVSQ